MPQPVAQLPWGHNILLIERIKDQTERFWYAEQTQIHRAETPCFTSSKAMPMPGRARLSATSRTGYPYLNRSWYSSP
nr:DUF1016 N-terminal domain-containing protein [Photorhabdus namnaonensis]